MRSDRENRWLRTVQHDRQRGVTPGTAQHHLPVGDDPNDGIIDVPDNWAIVHEKDIRDAAEALQSLVLVNTDWLLAQISARCHDREIQFAQEQMMQRRIWEHDAEIGISGSKRGSQWQGGRSGCSDRRSAGPAISGQ